jgi:hypothetical protein
MADINSYEADQIAALKKLHPSKHNRVRALTFRTPATYTAAQNDTVGSGMVIPAGSKLLPALVSSATNASAVTLSLGIRKRDAAKTAISATAIVNALAITTAQVSMPMTGVKITGGQSYVTPEDCEPYITLGGGTPTANAAIEVTVYYVAP